MLMEQSWMGDSQWESHLPYTCLGSHRRLEEIVMVSICLPRLFYLTFWYLEEENSMEEYKEGFILHSNFTDQNSCQQRRLGNNSLVSCIGKKHENRV